MNDKLKLEEIQRIPPGEFKNILHSWMNDLEVTKSMQTNMRKEMFKKFQSTEIAKKIHGRKHKMFSSKDYVIDTLQAEHLYQQNNHFSLSIFFTESRHTEHLPNFEGREPVFRFEKGEIKDLIELLGLKKSDKISRRVLNKYNNSSDSLLHVLLMELISSQNSVEARSVSTQTEEPLQQFQSLDLSLMSSRSKSKRSGRRKYHSLANKEFVARKPKKFKEVNLIAHNLERMSSNISIISSKLDDFRHHPTQDDSRTIIGYVGTIMSQLNGCIGNFETICRDIKQINETRNRNYDEWMDDLQNSENGRRFLKKLQKSFSRVMSDEKSKLKKEFRRKFERERSKLSKLSRSSAIRPTAKKVDEYPNNVVNEINEIYENTCLMIKSVEKESELFEKSLEMDHQKKIAQMSQQKTKPAHKLITSNSKLMDVGAKTTANSSTLLEEFPRPVEDSAKIKVSPSRKIVAETKLKFSSPKTNLNDCRQIHSTESSSEHSYSSKSFENYESDDNN